MADRIVVACLRHIGLRPLVDACSGTVTHDVHGAGLSATDEAALETAFQVADAWSCPVLAVAGGGTEVEGSLRVAVALGAEVLRVSWPDNTGSNEEIFEVGAISRAYFEDLGGDERALARSLASGIAAGAGGRNCGLVVCGARSSDRGTGALPAFLAHELGLAQALGLVSVVAEEHRILVERRLDGGRRERLALTSAALCSVEALDIRLRRASLPETIRALDARLPVVTSSDSAFPNGVRIIGTRAARVRTQIVSAPVGPSARERLLALTGVLVDHDPPTIVEPLDSEVAADALLDFLSRHGILKSSSARSLALHPTRPTLADAHVGDRP